MYALATMTEDPRECIPAEWAVDLECSGEGDCDLSEEQQFVEPTGLSEIQELAVGLGLVEIDDPALWEPA